MKKLFTDVFGMPPILMVWSPGRVNLIGDHTDYNDGWVFPAALDMGTFIAAHPRPDRIVRTVARQMDMQQDSVSLDNLNPHQGPHDWTRYVRGVASILQEQGYSLVGADMLIDATLPLGVGLSSSASLEMGVAFALLMPAGYNITKKERPLLAKLGQRVEHEVVGVQCGIMDQLIVACGIAGHALMIDCRTLEMQPAPIPDNVRLLVINSNMPRTLAGSAYNQRRGECEDAVLKIQAVYPQVHALRDVSPDMLPEVASLLTPVLMQRVRHVVTENQRVHAVVAALRRGDSATVGQLMYASHASLRDDYAVSSHALDTLVGLASTTTGVFGARLTGAGFGGCIVALAQAEHAYAAMQSITEEYMHQTGHAATGYVCAIGSGTQRI